MDDLEFGNHDYFLDKPNYFASLIFPGLAYFDSYASLYKKKTKIKGIIFVVLGLAVLVMAGINYSMLIEGDINPAAFVLSLYYIIIFEVFQNPKPMFFESWLYFFFAAFLLRLLSLWELYCQTSTENYYKMQVISQMTKKERQFMRMVSDVIKNPNKKVETTGPFYWQGRKMYFQKVSKDVLTDEAKSVAGIMRQYIDDEARRMIENQ